MHSTYLHAHPDVFEVKVPFRNVSTNATNCYIIRDGDDVLVVDTGAPTEKGASLLSEALDELGIDRTRARYFLTHMHLDHAGLVDAVVPSGATVYVSSVDFEAERATHAAAYFERVRRDLEQQGLSFSDASGFARYSSEPRLFDPERLDMQFVREDDTIRVGRFPFRVVETPGHTPGHLVLFEPQSRMLFGGDHILFVISPGIARFLDGANGLQAYLDSLEKVRLLGPRRLFLSHGDERDGILDRIAWLDRHHRERLEEAVSLVKELPGLTGEGVIRRIRWNVPADTWEDISYLQRGYILNQGIVMLDYLVDRGRIGRELDARGVYRYF